MDKDTHGHIEEVLRPLGEQHLIRSAKGKRLEHVSQSIVSLEHGVVDHVSKVYIPNAFSQSYRCSPVRTLTERLPVDSHQLTASRPIPVRFVVRRADPRTLGIRPHKMGLVVLDQVHHTLLQDLVRRVLGQREDMLGCVDLLLVQPTTLHADRVHQKRDKLEGHLHLGLLGAAGARARAGTEQGGQGWPSWIGVRPAAGVDAPKDFLGFGELGLEAFDHLGFVLARLAPLVLDLVFEVGVGGRSLGGGRLGIDGDFVFLYAFPFRDVQVLGLV